jgi:hypothetical protein
VECCSWKAATGNALQSFQPVHVCMQDAGAGEELQQLIGSIGEAEGHLMHLNCSDVYVSAVLNEGGAGACYLTNWPPSFCCFCVHRMRSKRFNLPLLTHQANVTVRPIHIAVACCCTPPQKKRVWIVMPMSVVRLPQQACFQPQDLLSLSMPKGY